MSEYRARVRRELLTRCVHLKTKASFFPMPREDEEASPFESAIWWCGRTCEALGPDGAAAHASPCGAPGRRCYEPPPAAGPSA